MTRNSRNIDDPFARQVIHGLKQRIKELETQIKELRELKNTQQKLYQKMFNELENGDKNDAPSTS